MKEYDLMDICDLKSDLIKNLRMNFAAGLDRVDTDEAGKVIDMVKDLAEAEYYLSIVEAMEHSEKSKNTWTKGSEEYFPHEHEREYNREDSRNVESKHGRTFDDYMKYKRYYTETKSPSQKDEMDAKANEYVGETLTTIRDIWKDADPEMRRRLKAEFVKLVNEMNV